jgi:hypothetical protein
MSIVVRQDEIRSDAVGGPLKGGNVASACLKRDTYVDWIIPRHESTYDTLRFARKRVKPEMQISRIMNHDFEFVQTGPADRRHGLKNTPGSVFVTDGDQTIFSIVFQPMLCDEQSINRADQFPSKEIDVQPDWLLTCVLGSNGTDECRRCKFQRLATVAWANCHSH